MRLKDRICLITGGAAGIGKATAKGVLVHLSGWLTRYKVPRRVKIVVSLPISAAGKTLKWDLCH